MVDYNKLFDVLYSDTIPFSVKESILESVKDQVSEEISEAEENPYINILNTLAYSDMSEDTINEIIDRVFGELDEAEVEDITNKFIKESCLNVIASGEIPVMEGSTDYIGLARMRRDERASHIHDNTPKPTVMDKLKGAVNKVKTAAKNSLPGYIMQDRPVGLSHIKGLDNKKPEAKKAEAPKAEEKKAGTSLVPVKSGVPAATKTATEAPKAETKTPQAQITASKVYSLPDLQKGKKAGRKEKVEQLKLNAGKKDKKVAETTKKEEATPAQEAPKAEIKKAKANKKAIAKAVEVAEKTDNKKAVEAPKVEPKKETKDPEAHKESAATSDSKFNSRVDALRKKMGVDDIKLNPDLVNKTGNKEEKKAEIKQEAPKVEAKASEAPKTVKSAEAPRAEENKNKNIGKVDKKVQANVEPSKKSTMTDEEREAKLARIKAKRENQESLKNTTKAIEDLQAQISMLKSKPGSSASDISDLETRLKDAQEKKKKYEDLVAAHESLVNPILNSLLTSVISESSMEEIIEMVCSKALAQKAAERERKQADDSMNNLNKVIEVEAETGKSPVTPEEKQELVDKANKDAEKYESVKASVERKYGK